jgi:hypothetical protein
MANNVFTKSDGFKSEYSAAVIRVGELTPIEGSDFLAKTNVFGTQIVVRKDQVHTGDIMIYAANETQLNEKFLSVNNLYEISCREKNANKEEVDEIYKPYEPIKAKADTIRNEAKNVKASMDNLTKKASKINKQVKKMTKDLESLDHSSEEYTTKKAEIDELQKTADDYTARAIAKTTTYTNLKKEVESIVKSGEGIIANVKKHCGYMNKYGRVRCLTLKNTPSFGVLFAPDDLIKYDPSITMEDIEAYVGQEFDTVNGDLFVKVYIPPMPAETQKKSNKNKAQSKVKRFDRMIDGEFFFHYGTSQLNKDIQYFKPSDIVDISVKLHGTSCIIGKLHVNQPIKLPFFKRMFNKFVDLTHLFKSLRITDSEVVYGPVYASRKVIKNKYINQDVTGGYYNADVWTEYGDIIYPYLDEGMTVYGEICGYLTGQPSMIQKAYDYGCSEGENNVMFYRITTTNEDGTKKEWEVSEVLDWTNKLIERMKEAGDENWKRIHPIDLLYHGTLEDLYPDLDTENHWHEAVLERMKNDKEHFGMEEPEPLCKKFPDSPREGFVLRKVGDTVLRAEKLKSVSFALKEALVYDSGAVDIEAVEGYGDDAVDA